MGDCQLTIFGIEKCDSYNFSSERDERTHSSNNFRMNFIQNIDVQQTDKEEGQPDHPLEGSSRSTFFASLVGFWKHRPREIETPMSSHLGIFYSRWNRHGAHLQDPNGVGVIRRQISESIDSEHIAQAGLAIQWGGPVLFKPTCLPLMVGGFIDGAVRIGAVTDNTISSPEKPDAKLFVEFAVEVGVGLFLPIPLDSDKSEALMIGAGLAPLMFSANNVAHYGPWNFSNPVLMLSATMIFTDGKVTKDR